MFLFLQKNPAQAAMMFNNGLQVGMWEVRGYDERRTILGRFQANVSIKSEGQEYTSSFHTALKKDLAKQLAIVDVLANIAGIVLPSPEIPESELWGERE